jgi:hypothetical protein
LHSTPPLPRREKVTKIFLPFPSTGAGTGQSGDKLGGSAARILQSVTNYENSQSVYLFPIAFSPLVEYDRGQKMSDFQRWDAI